MSIARPVIVVWLIGLHSTIGPHVKNVGSTSEYSECAEQRLLVTTETPRPKLTLKKNKKEKRLSTSCSLKHL